MAIANCVLRKRKQKFNNSSSTELANEEYSNSNTNAPIDDHDDNGHLFCAETSSPDFAITKRIELVCYTFSNYQ